MKFLLSFSRKHVFIAFASIILLYVNQPLYHLHYMIDYETPNFIAHLGYASQTHYVTTDDGYILALHRALKTTDDAEHDAGTRTRRVPVILGHGLIGSSKSWFFNEQSLVPLLLENEFDVWLLNFRGNCYSQNHTTLSTTSPEYWAFDWNDMGLSDLPAIASKVEEITGIKDSFMICYSQACTAALAGFATRGKDLRGVLKLYALAPVVFIPNIGGFVGTYARPPVYTVTSYFTRYLQGPRVLQQTQLRRWLVTWNGIVECYLMRWFFQFLVGSVTNKISAKYCLCYFHHVPCGSSNQTLEMYPQMLQTGRFGKYDWGRDENIRRYGEVTPPTHDLALVTTPLWIYLGTEDSMSVVQDTTDQLLPKLRTKVDVSIIQGFSHWDFVWAEDARSEVYDKILSDMSEVLRRK